MLGFIVSARTGMHRGLATTINFGSYLGVSRCSRAYTDNPDKPDRLYR